MGRVKIGVFFVLALLVTIPIVSATNGSTTVRIGSSNTLVIGTYNLPWPLDDYRMQIYSIQSLEGSNRLSWFVNKNFISPGEILSLTLDLEKGIYNVCVNFRVVIIKKSTSNTVFDKTLGPVNLGSIDVPGSWSSPPLAVPVIPFELGGIPVELNIFFRLSITSNHIAILNTYELQQGMMTLDFAASGTKTLSLSKQSGVGAEVRLIEGAVKVHGGITVSAGLSISGRPTPLKVDFGTAPIANWITRSAQNVEMVVLKTPVALDASLSSKVVNLGDTVIVSGRSTPPAAGIPVQLIVEGISLGTVETKGDGSFTFEWKPSYAGSFSVLIRAPGTKYTTSATSSTIQLIVNRPPEASFTFSPLNPSVVWVLLGVAVGAIVTVLLLKRRLYSL